MGIAKKKMMEDEERERVNVEYKSFFEELLQIYQIDNPLYGIAQQLIKQGYNTLTNKQKAIVEKYITNFKQNHICEKCGHSEITSLSDYLYLINHKYCPSCENEIQKIMED